MASGDPAAANLTVPQKQLPICVMVPLAFVVDCDARTLGAEPAAVTPLFLDRWLQNCRPQIARQSRPVLHEPS
jgi:hypothetical protein